MAVRNGDWCGNLIVDDWGHGCTCLAINHRKLYNLCDCITNGKFVLFSNCLTLPQHDNVMLDRLIIHVIALLYR